MTRSCFDTAGKPQIRVLLGPSRTSSRLGILNVFVRFQTELFVEAGVSGCGLFGIVHAQHHDAVAHFHRNVRTCGVPSYRV